MSKEAVKDRDLFGEYDPPYNINSNPTNEQREAAQALLQKYQNNKSTK